MNGSTAQVHAQELLLAAPHGCAEDLYLAHQAVWHATSHQRSVAKRPTLVYRVDGGLIRVRVSDCAMRGTRPVKAELAIGDVLPLRLRLALWLQVPNRTDRARIDQRIRDLMTQAGLELLSHGYSLAVASGYKAKQSSYIELPVVSLDAKVRIMQPDKVAEAWINGIGKGKRFGFGMLDFSASV